MAFKADEAARVGYDEVESYLVPQAKYANEAERQRSKEALLDIVDELGPVIHRYPSWHPLVRNHNCHNPQTIPNKDCLYAGLENTRYFAHGFITCPYGDGKSVLDSVKALPHHRVASISAEPLDVLFCNPSVTPILVRCDWDIDLKEDKTIPLSAAVPLLLETEFACLPWAEYGEPWKKMLPYFLGAPHGSRSSLFINQQTGQGMKKVWEALIRTGIFGPIKV